jgi:hypothetical protein
VDIPQGYTFQITAGLSGNTFGAPCKMKNSSPAIEGQREELVTDDVAWRLYVREICT